MPLSSHVRNTKKQNQRRKFGADIRWTTCSIRIRTSKYSSSCLQVLSVEKSVFLYCQLVLSGFRIVLTYSKVKCSGQPGGCNRCQAKRMTCMYAKSARRSKRSKPRVVCPTRSPPGSPAQNPDSSLPTLSQPEENWESLVVSELSPREDACDNAIADTETGLQCVSIDIALNQVLFDTTPDLDGTHSFAELQGDPCGSGTQGLSIGGLTSDIPSPNNFQELLDSFPNSVSANSRMNILPSLATDQRHVNNAGTTFSCGKGLICEFLEAIKHLYRVTDISPTRRPIHANAG